MLPVAEISEHIAEQEPFPIDHNPGQGEYESEPCGGDGQLRNSVVWDAICLVT